MKKIKPSVFEDYLKHAYDKCVKDCCPHGNTTNDCDICHQAKEEYCNHKNCKLHLKENLPDKDECRQCGNVFYIKDGCRNCFTEEELNPPKDLTATKTQEPMEEKWIEEFDNCIKFVGSPEQYYNNVKQFLSSQIKQAEERHNLDCTREEWARARERERITMGIKELLQTPAYNKDQTYDIAINEVLTIITNQ